MIECLASFSRYKSLSDVYAVNSIDLTSWQAAVWQLATLTAHVVFIRWGGAGLFFAWIIATNWGLASATEGMVKKSKWKKKSCNLFSETSTFSDFVDSSIVAGIVRFTAFYSTPWTNRLHTFCFCLFHYTLKICCTRGCSSTPAKVHSYIIHPYYMLHDPRPLMAAIKLTIKSLRGPTLSFYVAQHRREGVAINVDNVSR